MKPIIIISVSAPIFTMIGPLLAHQRNQLSTFEKNFDQDSTTLFVKRLGEQMLQEQGLSLQVGCNIRHFQTDADEELANSGVLFEFENEELTPILEKLAHAIRTRLDNFVELTRETPIEIAPLQQQIVFDIEDQSDKKLIEDKYSKLTFNDQDHERSASEPNPSEEINLPHFKNSYTTNREEQFQNEKQIVRELIAELKCSSVHLRDSLGEQRGTFKTPEKNTQIEPLKCNAFITGIPTFSPLKITIKFHAGKKSFNTQLNVPINSNAKVHEMYS